MKKLLLFTVICAFALSSFAQFKPEKGFTTELQFTPFGNQAFQTIGINGRYFFSENIAVRANLNFGLNSTKTVVNPDETTEITTKGRGLLFGITPGVEYHFGNFERVSPYAGAQIGFTTYGTKYTGESNSYSYEAKNWDGTSQNGYNRISFGIFVGTDVYVWEGLYLGAEFGLGFNHDITKAGHSNTTVGTVSVETDYIDKSSATGLNFNALPQIRLGWRF